MADSNDIRVWVRFDNTVKSLLFKIDFYKGSVLNNDSESIACELVMLHNKLSGFELILLDLQIIRGWGSARNQFPQKTHARLRLILKSHLCIYVPVTNDTLLLTSHTVLWQVWLMWSKSLRIWRCKTDILKCNLCLFVANMLVLKTIMLC